MALYKVAYTGFKVARAGIVVDGVDVKEGRQGRKQRQLWHPFVPDAQDEMLGVKGADHGGVALVIGRHDLGAPGLHNAALHASQGPWGWPSPRDLGKAPIRGAPLLIQETDPPPIIRLQVGKKRPTPWRVFPEAEIKGKDVRRVPGRLVVQKVAQNILHASKGLHLLPEVVCIRSLPERGIEDIMGMRPKVDIDLLGHLKSGQTEGLLQHPAVLNPQSRSSATIHCLRAGSIGVASAWP